MSTTAYGTMAAKVGRSGADDDGAELVELLHFGGGEGAGCGIAA